MTDSETLANGENLADSPYRMPAATSLLRWVYVGRVCVASVILFSASLFPETSRGVIVTVTIAAFLSLLVTGGSFFHTHIRGSFPSQTFLYAQMLFDLGLVTAVVHVTGGAESDFASLYILIIAVSAVTMSMRSSLLVTILAAVLYIADVVFGHPVQLSVTLFLQAGVFVLVALAISYLASRVRLEGEARTVLEREVKRLRLEAGDILRQIQTGVITVDGDGVLVFANAAAERLLKFTAVDYLGRPMLEFIDSVAPALCTAIVTTQRQRRWRLRLNGMVTTGGGTFPVGVTTTLHETGGEGPDSVTAIFTDISDQVRLQELHSRTERLEAVAELSASLAHEIKNPLASIRSSVEQLGTSVRADEDDRFLAELVVRESDRLSRLLTDFLDFSRVSVAESQLVDLGGVARAAVAVVREHPDCPEDARIRVNGARVRILGDEDLLHRVVLNLVLNALQASEGQAEVVVEIREAEATELPAEASLGPCILLAVSDTGPGVPEELRDRLFDPFVTGRTGGTGLGLSVVQRAVVAHRGLMFVDTEIGKGTTFSIFLPKSEKSEKSEVAA